MEKHDDTKNHQKSGLTMPDFIVEEEQNCNHIAEQDFLNFHNGTMTEEDLLTFM